MRSSRPVSGWTPSRNKSFERKVPTRHVLMTSTSITSRSDKVPEALSVGGGGSMAAAFFLFFDAQKLPKKPVLGSLIESIVGLALPAPAPAPAEGGKGLPVFGST